MIVFTDCVEMGAKPISETRRRTSARVSPRERSGDRGVPASERVATVSEVKPSRADAKAFDI